VGTNEELNEYQQTAFRRVSEYYRRISPIISYELPPPQKESFSAFHRFVSQVPTSTAVKLWASNNSRWHEIAVEGILGSVQNSLTIAHYHCNRIGSLETAVTTALQNFPIDECTTIGGGNTLVFDAEYQAFILSCRRCLDQLSYALVAFFKSECSSFRGLEKHLKLEKFNPESNLLLDALMANKNNFLGSLLPPTTDKKSERDQIAHFKSVSAGVLNVNQRGVYFCGGASFYDRVPFEINRVTKVTATLMSATQKCVDELILALIETLQRRFDLRGEI
jgi:hypothetical protein